MIKLVGESAGEAGCRRERRGRARASPCRERPCSPGGCAEHGLLSDLRGEKAAWFYNHRVSLGCLSISFPSLAPGWLSDDWEDLSPIQTFSHPGDHPKLSAVGFWRGTWSLALQPPGLTFPRQSWLHAELQIKFRMERLSFRALQVHWGSVWAVIGKELFLVGAGHAGRVWTLILLGPWCF